MSGRTSPYGARDDEGLPTGVYVNPDNLPPADPTEIAINQSESRFDPSIMASSSSQGGSGARKSFQKMGNFLKKGTDKLKKNKNKDTAGASQLGDVMGRRDGSSVMSSQSGGTSRDRVDVTQPAETTRSKPPRLSSFKDMFKRDHHHGNAGLQQSSMEERDPHRSTFGGARMDTMRTSVRNFFKGPPPPSPPMSPDAETEIAPLKPPPPRSPCRVNLVLMAGFILMMIIGIILIIAGVGGQTVVKQHCQVLGPTFLGLAGFGLIGEIFFMLFWKENPLPFLNETVEKMNAAIGAVQDPYGLKQPYQPPQRASYYPGLLKNYVGMGSPPVSPVAMSPDSKEAIPMYPLPPIIGDEELPLPSGPTGPAAFGPGPGGPAAFGDGPPPGAPSMYYADPPSRDESFDSRARTADTSSPGISNTSYQPDHENFMQNRLV